MSVKPFSDLVAEAKSEIAETTVEEVNARREAGEPFHLVDVREDAEWEKGRIPGALHLGRGVIDRDIAGQIPDPEAEIVLYCGSGARSAMAAKTLQAMGYRSVKSMAGGFTEWSKAGLPAE